MRIRLTKNRINTALNMAIATFIATVFGIVLGMISFPHWLICGTVATIAVLTEYVLAMYPLHILDKLEEYYKRLKEKVLL